MPYVQQQPPEKQKKSPRRDHKQAADTQDTSAVGHVVCSSLQTKSLITECVKVSEVGTLTSSDTARFTELLLIWSKFTGDILPQWQSYSNSLGCWFGCLECVRDTASLTPTSVLDNRKEPITARDVITRGGAYYIKISVCGSPGRPCVTQEITHELSGFL